MRTGAGSAKPVPIVAVRDSGKFGAARDGTVSRCAAMQPRDVDQRAVQRRHRACADRSADPFVV